MNRRLWKCAECGRVDVWGPGWAWYGRYGKRHEDEYQISRVVCSEKCRKGEPLRWEAV